MQRGIFCTPALCALPKPGFVVMAPGWHSGRFVQRWPKEQNPETELEIDAAPDALRKMPSACKTPVDVSSYPRGGDYALLAAKRAKLAAAFSRAA